MKRLYFCLLCLGLAWALPACKGLDMLPAGPAASTPSATIAIASTEATSPPAPTAPPPATATFTPVPPSPTPVIEATPTAAPSLVQLTSGGCCVQPFWSPDGSRLLFIDRPDPGAPAGIYGVDLQGGPPQLFTQRLGLYSADMQYLAFPQNGVAVVERLADGQRWRIANGGRAVSFSPDGSQIAWTAGQSGPPFDTAQRCIWVSKLDGSQARTVADVIAGGLIGWFPDSRLLLSGRRDPGEAQSSLWALTPGQTASESQWQELVRTEQRMRSVSLSPGGGWLVYLVSFASDPAADGIWLVDTFGGQPKRLALFGGYQWRDEGRLLVIPLEPGASSQQLWQVEASNGQALPLTDPAVTPFKIANGDWSVSPDGHRIAFVSALDNNIWLLTLPAR
jgi:Tol biopolymer transport system component